MFIAWSLESDLDLPSGLIQLFVMGHCHLRAHAVCIILRLL